MTTQAFDLAMVDQHPWVQVVVGHRGSGKSVTISSILSRFPAQLGQRLAVDVVAADPPLPDNIAAYADRWRRVAPAAVPAGVGLIACDEALVYRETGGTTFPTLYLELALRGRHAGERGPDGRRRGVSLLLGTQRPKQMPLTVMTQASRVIMHCCQLDADLERLEELPGMTREALAMIPRLPPGYAVIWDARQGLFYPEIPEWRR